jgi:hypothetical protein
MSWERAALEQVIRLLIKSDIEHGKLFSKLHDLGVELNIDGAAYQILRELTEFEYLSENLDAIEENHMKEEEFLKFYMEDLEKSFNKQKDK